jgi:hypothetical protein
VGPVSYAALQAGTLRHAWLALGACLAVVSASPGAEPERAPVAQVKAAGKDLTPEDLAQVHGLLERLRLAFLAGDSKQALGLFVARGEEETLQREQLAQNLRREFKSETYEAFEVPEAALDEQVSPGRYRFWLRLRTVSGSRRGGAAHENRANECFLLERQSDGSFALVDSAWLDTLGQRQGVGLVADAILAAILALAGLTFWVWMGYQAFNMRPRSVAWRTVVAATPLVGALVFFFVKYVPGLWQGSRMPTGEPAGGP